MKLCFGLALVILLTGSVHGRVPEVDSGASLQLQGPETGEILSDVHPSNPNINTVTRTINIENVVWHVGRPLDIQLGPNDAVYCKIQNSNGHIMFDDFGQCKIEIDRVTVGHRGTWKLYIGLPGSVQLQEVGFTVEVLERGNRPVVSTAVTTDKPAVILTCSVPSQHEVRACKFRDPQSNILIASHETGQSGYTFNGVVVNYETNAGNHDCTLKLTNPSVQDLGIWRCAMDTSVGTFYGYLTVVCPFAMRDPDVAAAVVTEPVLVAENNDLVYHEDEPVIMSCFIPAPIRYCYFRARNGTVFNVFPDMSSSGNFQYTGAGLDAGECGVRFNRMSASESGSWSCHVGLVDVAAEEQRASISVLVRAQMEVQMMWQGTSAVVEAVVSHPYTIDYCRFVRMNGLGFTINNVPDGYTISATNTVCSLLIRQPDIVDLHPWAVAVKLNGQDGEISGSTNHLLDHLINSNPNTSIVGDVFFWLFIAVLCLLPVICVFVLFKKKNRQWTQKRASNLSNSFRNSWSNTFSKKPPVTAGNLQEKA